MELIKKRNRTEKSNHGDGATDTTNINLIVGPHLTADVRHIFTVRGSGGQIKSNHASTGCCLGVGWGTYTFHHGR